jgi:DNA-binding MarR family transcriptional regulator
MKAIGSIIAILTLFGIFFGAYRHFENRYALAEGLKKTNQTLNYHMTSEKYDRKQKQILELELKYPEKSKMSPELRELYEELKMDKEEYKRQLDKMEQK